MNENKNEDLMLGVSSKSIKMDLLRFKDDILKDMKKMENRLNKKYLNIEESINEKINTFELKINSFEQKIIELSNFINIDKSMKEKIESLEQFKEEMKDTLFTRRAKYNEFEKKVNDEINRINDTLLDSVIYPGIFGPSTKFKTFHDFIDYVLFELNQLILFKDKSGLDLNPFKKKIEQYIEAFKIQINNLCSKEFTINSINQSEESIKGIVKLYEDSLKKIRFESMNNNFEITKKLDKLNKQIEILNILKNKLKKKEDDNKEIIIIKNEINSINNILKELLSFHPTINKLEIEKKSSKIYSGVKQYIKGNLNAHELSSMKKFVYNTNSKKNKSINNSHSSIKMKHSLDLNKKKINTNASLDNNYNSNEGENKFFITHRSLKSIVSKDEENINNKEIQNKNECNNEVIPIADNKIIRKDKEKENNSNEAKKEEKPDNAQYYISEEDDNILSSKNNINLFSLYDNFENNNIQMNNLLIKEKIGNNKINPDKNKIINLINKINSSYDFENNGKYLNMHKINNNEIKKEEINNNENKTSRILNISKVKNYYQLFKPYKIELTDNNDIIESSDRNLKYNTSFTGPSKILFKQMKNNVDEKNKFKVNINNNKSNNSKTFTNFPKINKELLEQKVKFFQDSVFLKNKMVGVRSLYSIGENNSNKEIKVAAYVKKPKKILLTSPDNIPPNKIFRRKKRNKSNRFKSEKNRDKQFNNIFSELDYKDRANIISNFQSYNSLYQLISSNEEPFIKNKNFKNKKNNI